MNTGEKGKNPRRVKKLNSMAGHSKSNKNQIKQLTDTENKLVISGEGDRRGTR